MEINGVPTSAAETLLVTSAVTRVTTNLDGQSNTSPMLLQVLSNGIHLGFGQSCTPFVTDFTFAMMSSCIRSFFESIRTTPSLVT